MLSKILDPRTFTVTLMTAKVSVLLSEVTVTVIMSESSVVFFGTVTTTRMSSRSVDFPFLRSLIESVEVISQLFFDFAVIV